MEEDQIQKAGEEGELIQRIKKERLDKLSKQNQDGVEAEGLEVKEPQFEELSLNTVRKADHKKSKRMSLDA